MHVADADQVRDPPGQHPGLAGAGSGHDQHRTAGVHDGLALRRVEAGEQLLLADLAARRSAGCGRVAPRPVAAALGAPLERRTGVEGRAEQVGKEGV